MTDAVPPAPVVAGVDGSIVGARALAWAVDFARRHDAPVRAVLALPQLANLEGLLDSTPATTERSAAIAILDGELAAHRGSGVDITPVLADDTAAHVLLDEAERAALVVVGSRGRGGFGELLVGSTSLQVAMHAHCPVVVVRGPQASRTEPGPAEGQVVVGVDDLERTAAAVGFAFAEAASRGIGLTAVRAWVAPDLLAHLPPTEWAAAVAAAENDEAGVLPASLQPWQARYPDVDVTPRLIRGDPAEVLIEESAGAALLVVGSRGRGGFTGLLLGSVSHSALHYAHCPVAIVRS